MSLHFDNTVLNTISCGAGTATAVGSGAYTMVALVLTGTFNTNSGIVVGYLSGSAERSLLIDTGQLFGEGFDPGFGTLTTANWYWAGISKTAGSQQQRFHLAPYVSSGSFTWSHGTSSANVHGDHSPLDEFRIGDGNSRANLDMAAMAVFTSALSDLQIETACSRLASDLQAASPSAFWTMPLANGTNPLVDLTGGGANENSRTAGITASADPPSYSFSLSQASPKGGQFLAFFS